MKQAANYSLVKIADSFYILPYGQNIANHRRGVRLNDTGIFLWNLLAQERSKEELFELFIRHYEAEPEEVDSMRADFNSFLSRLTSLGMIVSDRRTSLPFRNFVIGGISIRIYGASFLLFSSFDAFEAASCPDPDLTIRIHTAPEPVRKDGTLILHNPDFVLYDCDEFYSCSFPSSASFISAKLAKSGKDADLFCCSLSPESSVDIFHAIRLLYLYRAEFQNIFAIHSASVLYHGKAWLFSAPSGTGKSTHTALWQKYFHTPVINGDLNLITLKNNVPYVHGLPWCGTSDIFDTASYPLGGIILLRQSENDFIEELPAEEQILSVAQRFISPAWTPEQLNTLLSFSDELHDKIYIRRLHCTKKESAARLMQKEINIWEKGFYNEN